MAFGLWTIWTVILCLWQGTGHGGARVGVLWVLHDALTAKDFLPHSENHKGDLLPSAAVEIPNSQ